MAPTPGKLTPRQQRIRSAARRVFWICLAAAALGLIVWADRAGLFGRAPASDVARYHGRTFRVVHVVDGDTLDVDISDGRDGHTRVRLWGVDTPETVKPDTPIQHFGPQATAYTAQLTLHKHVMLRLEPGRNTRDKHGRLLAYVILPNGRMLNRLLLQHGYAYADPRYDHTLADEFADLHRRARRQRLGLWEDLPPDQLPYYLKP